MNTALKFADLATGERFLFDDPRAGGPSLNRRWGPFTKVARELYRADNGTECRPDTVGYRVTRYTDPTPAEAVA